MKQFRKMTMWTILLFIALIITVTIACSKISDETNRSRYVFMNYIVHEIQREYDASERTGTKIIEQFYYGNLKRWQTEYGEDRLPKRIYYEEISGDRNNINLQIKAETNSYVWNLYSSDDTIVGFIMFEYEDGIYPKIVIMVDIIIIVCALIVVGFSMFIQYKILKPFEEFSEYPERLSKGEIAEKLPETKNRYVGKYIWGMNMLNDKLTVDAKRTKKLYWERQTLVSTLVHGIKTPLSNIKLYANAISTGLYKENGSANEEDAKIAYRIENNVGDIERLVTEIAQVSSVTLFEYEPHISLFYLKEVEEYILQEYSNRFNVNRIPLSIERCGNPLLNSDKDGICRILSQLIDNAIKYGDGTGVVVIMDKQEEGYYLAVNNKGVALPESELPYVFNCFWRGSNAGDTEGNGIGLYEAKRIATSIGGDIFIKSFDDEVEVAIFLFDVEE